MTTDNSEPSSEAPKGFKVTFVQGIIGAISLAGTTAIPLLVTRYLDPQPPTASPAPAAQVSPAPAATTAPLVTQPTQTAVPDPMAQMQTNTAAPQEMQMEEGGKGKRGKKVKD